jgi:hypothetical protein
VAAYMFDCCPSAVGRVPVAVCILGHTRYKRLDLQLVGASEEGPRAIHSAKAAHAYIVQAKRDRLPCSAPG